MSKNNEPITAPVYPKHGWILKGQNKAYIVLPFLGCISHIRNERNGKDLQYRDFSAAYRDLVSRFMFWVKSLELWYGKSASFPYPAENLLLKDLYTDLCLYELSCLFDSLARVLAFIVSNDPKKVNTSNFHKFRKWVITHETSIKTPWIIGPLKNKDLDDVKKLRNLRTHKISQYDGISNFANNTVTQGLSVASKNGKRAKHDVIGSVKGTKNILFCFLESITPNLEAGDRYSQDDILGFGMLGYPSEWTPGPWLNELIGPCLSQEPCRI